MSECRGAGVPEFRRRLAADLLAIQHPGIGTGTLCHPAIPTLRHSDTLTPDTLHLDTLTHCRRNTPTIAIDTMSQLPLVRFSSLYRYEGLAHGVSTRQGGVSAGPFASLNLGWTVGDARENVEANYRRLAMALGVPRRDLTTTWQVHGSRIVRAQLEDRGSMIDKADGIVTDVPELPLSQRYADCTPVLVYDPRRHAAGLVHAGWRGTVAGASSALVTAMVDEFGSDPEHLVAVVGPAIGPCCYRVGPEVVDAVRWAWPAAGQWLVPVAGDAPERDPVTNGGLHFDLWEANRWQLAQAGVQQIEVAGICTCCSREVFFSHRGDQGRTGRFAAVMMLRS